MATVVKTAAGTWKAVVRKHGWPPAYKTFRTKRDALDWSRRTEDEMVRGVFIDRTDAEQLTLKQALERYVREVSPTKRRWTSKSEVHRARTLTESLGSYSLAAITPDLIAEHRDKRLALGLKADTVRLELALLSHLYTIAMREWRLGLLYNPVALVRKPPPGPARTIPLTQAAATALKEAIDHPLRPKGCDMIFYGEPGRDGVRRPFEFNPAWQQVLKDHGITGLRFHDLRHEAVSRLVEAGLGDQEVAAISGHKSMQMLRRYTHLRAEDLVVKLDRLGVR